MRGWHEVPVESKCVGCGGGVHVRGGVTRVEDKGPRGVDQGGSPEVGGHGVEHEQVQSAGGCAKEDRDEVTVGNSKLNRKVLVCNALRSPKSGTQ